MNQNATDLRRYWDIIRERKGLIVGGTLLCVALTLIISFIIPPVYESSLILEIGELYAPPEENIKLEVKEIEEPMAVTEVLKSPQFLERTRQELKMKLPLEKMEDRLAVEQVVELTRFQRSESPLVKLAYEDSSPRMIVRILNSLARQLIKEHTREYNSSIKMLRDRIKNLRDKITAARKLAASQKDYQDRIKEQTKLVHKGITDYEDRLKKLNFKETERTEALFFKSTLNSMKEQIIDMQKEYNEANLAIGEADEKIQEYKDQIANLNNLIELTKNTKIRSEAVLADEPVRPNKLLNTLAAGGLALILITLFVFFQDHLKSSN